MNLDDASSLEHYSVVTAIILYLLKGSWEFVIGSAKRRLEALETNTRAVAELQVHIKELKKVIEEFPRLKQDIAAAHSKIREINHKFDQ